MVTILRDVSVNLPIDAVWKRLRQVGLAHELFAGVLVDGRIDGDLRTVTFANGMVVTEQILGVDEPSKRVAYSVIDGPFERHAASMQAIAEGAGSRVLWFSEFKPDALSEMVTPLMEAGLAALKRNLEGGSAD